MRVLILCMLLGLALSLPIKSFAEEKVYETGYCFPDMDEPWYTYKEICEDGDTIFFQDSDEYYIEQAISYICDIEKTVRKGLITRRSVFRNDYYFSCIVKFKNDRDDG